MNSLQKDWPFGKDVGILLLRVLFGFVLIYGHGFEKLATIFSGAEIHFMNPIGIGADLSFYLAAFAEGICSLLLIFGLFTRYAAIILTINFLVIFSLHAFKFGDGFQTLEPRAMYLFAYIAFIFMGGGKFSLDYFFAKRKLKQ